jgi:hypothetical protein
VPVSFPTLVLLECSVLGENMNLRLALSLITDDNDYQRQQASAAQDAATRLGVNPQTFFAGNDAIHYPESG